MSKSTTHSNKMAEAATAVRAAHSIYEHGAIFNDPYAIYLTSKEWRFVTRHRWLYQLIVKRMFTELRPVQGQVLARSRFAEDRLEKAIRAGITQQYVIIAAGFDSFVLRRPGLVAHLHVVEIDHPTTQQLKNERLDSLGITMPSNLTYLPVDLNQQNIQDVLHKAPVDRSQPTFFSWLGTIPYLSRGVIFDTLRAIAETQKAGSEVVFDYASTNITPEDQPAVDRLISFTEQRGEPLITQFDPAQLNVQMNDLGFEVIANISQSTWRQYYYDDPQLANLRPLSAAYIAHLRVR